MALSKFDAKYLTFIFNMAASDKKVQLHISSRLVLGRFRDPIRKDSILLAIFAREREDSIQKSKNRFVSKLEPVY
jgi:hypothetical protein